ncbi:putative Importin alpha re-exporter [Paratrimastix pyriformis]|uniref:Importin alpha re-exporter n=1 Tax=Paratrimastix pyriformis TaxID=342808 RepID=A0ABQ8UGG4_9EUKA|nr:putative Importin alpha re-exporter [Paratrimastix pyriformis]
MQTLVPFLQNLSSGDPARIKEAEKLRESMERIPQYPLHLLQVISQPPTPDMQQCCAILFKNFILAKWVPSEDEHTDVFIDEDSRKRIKDQLIAEVLRGPSKAQAQLLTSIEFISKTDFPKNWNFLPDLVAKLQQTSDIALINTMLTIVRLVLKRFRHEYECNELLLQIKYVLDIIQQPLLTFIQQTTAAAESQLAALGSTRPAPAQLTPLMQTLQCYQLCLKIYYSLNCQGLPAFFEDHLEPIMTSLHKLLVVQCDALCEDSDKASILDRIQSLIVNIVVLYTQRYEEEMAPFLGTFVTAIWNLLMRSGSHQRLDKLVTNAIRFLVAIAEGVHHQLFNNEAGMRDLAERVILPNLRLTEADADMFEDEPKQFIQFDTEGSDVGTRRRAAMELVRALCKHFQQNITTLMLQVVASLLQSYAQNPAEKWGDKTTAILVIMSLCAKGFTLQKGVTQTDHLQTVIDFFNSNIVPELQAGAQNPNQLPLVRAYALRYVWFFRNQLPAASLAPLLPILVAHLPSTFVVVQTYAANTIERLLLLRDEQGNPRMPRETMSTQLGPMLTNFFAVLGQEKTQESEEIMKAVARVIHLSPGRELLPLTQAAVERLGAILDRVMRNPRIPGFNHNLFEAIGALIKNVCLENGAAVTQFEGILQPSFNYILQNDVQEFMPYVFQLYSLLLDVRTPPLPPSYLVLVTPLLDATLWSRSGNVPALARLLRTYIRKGWRQLFANTPAEAALVGVQHPTFMSIMGIFQKLFASSTHDAHAIQLLDTLVECIGTQESEYQRLVQPVMGQVLTLLFRRLQKGKTPRLVAAVVRLIALLIHRRGAEYVLGAMNAVQAGIFSLIVQQVWLPSAKEILNWNDRRAGIVTMTTLVADYEPFMAAYPQDWVALLKKALELFNAEQEAPPKVVDTEVENASSSVALTQIMHLHPPAATSRLHATHGYASSPICHTTSMRTPSSIPRLPYPPRLICTHIPSFCITSQIDENPGYTAAFARLHYAALPASDPDPFAAVTDPRAHFVTHLFATMTKTRGKFGPIFGQILTAEEQQQLAKLLQDNKCDMAQI